VDIKIELEQPEKVNLTAIGLIASGYDLYSKTDPCIPQLANEIIDQFKGEERIKNYFARARSNQVQVNPYWPKGSGIMAASLFVSEDYSSFDLDHYSQFERESNSSALWNNRDYLNWVLGLKEMLRDIRDFPTTSAILKTIAAIIKRRRATIYKQLTDAKQIISEFINDSFDPGNMVFIPNVLQAPESTDYVRKENTLYVLAVSPDHSSLIHELLHSCLLPHRDQIQSLVQLNGIQQCFEPQKLRELGYSWDESFDSTIRCVEESLVRSLTEIVSPKSYQEKKASLQYLSRQGFLVATKFIPLVGIPIRSSDLPEMLNKLLC
jgi:hypothetical protein